MSGKEGIGRLFFLVVAFGFIGVFFFAGSVPAAPLGGKADLVITSFGLKEWGKCEENQSVFKFQVVVKNAGNAPSPSLVNGVRVYDGHPGIVWGNGEAIGPLSPGATQTVMVPIPYFLINRAHMITGSPHPFKAVVDPDNAVNKGKAGTNSSEAVNVDLSGICKQAGKRP